MPTSKKSAEPVKDPHGLAADAKASAKLHEGAAEAKPAPKRKATVSQQQLEEAATLRAAGATWNAIRAATGSKLGSSAWFRLWETAGVKHIPAGERVKPSTKAVDTAAAKPAEPSSQGKGQGKGSKPQSGAEKPAGPLRGGAQKATAKAKAKAEKPARKGTARTSNGTSPKVTVRRATAAERERSADDGPAALKQMLTA